MGSVSDLPVMKGSFEMLDRMGVGYEKRVLSAHRTPAALEAWVKESQQRGVAVFIAAAGGAAHLAGVVAAFTTLPVIAVPIMTKALGGLDSLLAMVQMPSGIPVATVAIDGAKNAALLAVEMLSISNPELREKVAAFRKDQADKILETEI